MEIRDSYLICVSACLALLRYLSFMAKNWEWEVCHVIIIKPD